jgi:hypothetical protein
LERTLNITRRYLKTAAIIIITGILLSAAACGSSDTKTFSIKEGVQGFSFEYPSSYSLVRIDLSNTADSQYTTIGLGANTGGVISEIYVYVWPETADLSTPTATVDTLLSNAQGVLTDFTLDKKTAATVNGQIAAGASFTATDTGSGSAGTTGPAYYRLTCYIHNGLIIELDMTCDVSLKDSTQSQYDNLLQTFAALDK